MAHEPAVERRILALCDDLMAASRIEATLAAAGYAVRSASATAAVDATRGWRPNAIVIGFGLPSRAWEGAIRAIRADAALGATPVLAFGPHVDVEGRAAATAAGATLVVTNGAFFNRMPAMIANLLGDSSLAGNR